MKWKQTVMGEWPRDPVYDNMLRRWCDYNIRCEEYDRSICTGRRNDIAFPFSSTERKTISVHARGVHDELFPHRLSWSTKMRETYQRAKNCAAGMSADQLHRVLDALKEKR